jgi:hypothetical protein
MTLIAHLVGFAGECFGHRRSTMMSMCEQNLVQPVCFVKEPATEKQMGSRQKKLGPLWTIAEAQIVSC